MQWGYWTGSTSSFTTTVSFPTAFPSIAIGFAFAPYCSSSNWYPTRTTVFKIVSFSTAQMIVSKVGDTYAINHYYIVIGY